MRILVLRGLFGIRPNNMTEPCNKPIPKSNQHPLCNKYNFKQECPVAWEKTFGSPIPKMSKIPPWKRVV